MFTAMLDLNLSAIAHLLFLLSNTRGSPTIIAKTSDFNIDAITVPTGISLRVLVCDSANDLLRLFISLLKHFNASFIFNAHDSCDKFSMQFSEKDVSGKEKNYT
jgi:hypothetical protein